MADKKTDSPLPSRNFPYQRIPDQPSKETPATTSSPERVNNQTNQTPNQELKLIESSQFESLLRRLDLLERDTATLLETSDSDNKLVNLIVLNLGTIRLELTKFISSKEFKIVLLSILLTIIISVFISKFNINNFTNNSIKQESSNKTTMDNPNNDISNEFNNLLATKQWENVKHFIELQDQKEWGQSYYLSQLVGLQKFDLNQELHQKAFGLGIQRYYSRYKAFTKTNPLLNNKINCFGFDLK